MLFPGVSLLVISCRILRSDDRLSSALGRGRGGPRSPTSSCGYCTIKACCCGCIRRILMDWICTQASHAIRLYIAMVLLAKLDVNFVNTTATSMIFVTGWKATCGIYTRNLLLHQQRVHRSCATTVCHDTTLLCHVGQCNALVVQVRRQA